MSRPLPNLARITRLRELFLEEQQSKRTIADYWRDARDIEAYDAVLAARIGWKWDAALRECADRGFDRADDQVVLDYGCGSGVAARRFVTHFGAGRLWLHDRSPHAMAFAQESLAATAPSVSSGPLKDVRDANPDVLLVSHVLGELDQAGEDELRALISRSKRVLIVEPGNRTLARRLSGLRDDLLDRFSVIAPCPHQRTCPALAAENDWCHFFATPPPEVFTDGFWARVARELSIDLRSLPYAFLAMARQDEATTAPTLSGDVRLLGRAEIHKHFARVRSCSEAGLEQIEIPKRHEPQIWRALKKRPEQVREAQAERDRD
jgi:hypothetical protein